MAYDTRGRSILLKFGHILEGWLVGALFFAVRSLPAATASAIGGWLGRTFGPRIPRSSVARRNMSLAFPEKTTAELEAIVRGMWDNLGRTLLEFPHLDRVAFLVPDSPLEVIGAQNVVAAGDDGLPGVFFSAHLANWELLGPLAASFGVPLHLFYRAPNNPHLAWLYDRRHAAIAGSVPKGAEGAKLALRLLRNGAHLGMLVDQKMNDGIAVPFFGRDAMTAPAIAELAFRFECPVIPARIERLGGFRFRVTIAPPLHFERSGDRPHDVRAAMTKINAVIEHWVRERPDQWLWLHRRWPESR